MSSECVKERAHASVCVSGAYVPGVNRCQWGKAHLKDRLPACLVRILEKFQSTNVPLAEWQRLLYMLLDPGKRLVVSESWCLLIHCKHAHSQPKLDLRIQEAPA
jgi:hypothetical protein